MNDETIISPLLPRMDRIIMLLRHPVIFMSRFGFLSSPWLPIIIVASILAILQFAMLPELLATYDDPDYAKQLAEKTGMTEAAAREDIEQLRKSAPYLGLIEAPVVVVTGAAGVAAVIYLVGRIQFRRKVPYLDLFYMVAWGSLVSVIPLAINTVARFIKDDLLIPTNASALLPKTLEGTYLYNIMLAVDPFLIWQVWLMGLGMAALYEVNRQKAITSVGTMFVSIAVLNALTLTLAGK